MPVLGTSNAAPLKNSVTPETYGAVGNTPAHDDAPAIEAAIFAAVAACIADGSYVCEVVFDAAKNYYANRAPIYDQTIGGVHSYAYAQIALPYITWDWHAPNATPLVTLTLRTRSSGQASNTTFNAQPCSIISTPTTGAGFATGKGVPSVVGGASRGWGETQAPVVYSGINLIWDGINIVSQTANPVFTGLDIGRVNTCELRSLHVYVPTNGYAAPTMCTNPASWGVILPGNQNGGNIRVGLLEVVGYFTGLSYSEHLVADNVTLYWNRIAFGADQSGAHEAIIQYVSTAGNNTLIGATGGTTNVINSVSVAASPLIIDLWGSEDGSAILDSSNVLTLQVNAFYPEAGGLPSVTGGKNVRLVNLRQARGAVATPPAIPASTTVYTNVYGRDAWVVVTGGTVTGIAVDGTTTGLTSGQILVPNGKTITLTYSAAPTWTWFLF